MGLKDQILSAEDIRHEDVTVPEWGGVKVRIRGLNGTQRDSFEAKMVALKKGGQDVELRLADFRSKFLVKCLYDPETDSRIFGDGDAQALGRKSSAVIDRLFEVAQRLSGMSDDSVEEAKGNSTPAQSEGSTSA